MGKSLIDYLPDKEKSTDKNYSGASIKEPFSDILKKFTFKEDGKSSQTTIDKKLIGSNEYSRYINEFWTSKQRKASSIHEISYRACFKPQLPEFFIKRLTNKSDIVYDPFSGRGTTILEAGRLARNVIQNDINPLSRILIYPRFFIPTLHAIAERLNSITINERYDSDIDLSMFYHQQTLDEIIAIKEYMIEREETETLDNLDSWIRMVATNRLTGHSPGFFSVYTLPPNQAVSPESQIKINQKRNQVPPYRDTKKIIIRKTKSLLKNVTSQDTTNLKQAGMNALFLNHEASYTPEIANETVQLTVTSPPFLNIVQYAKDNWLRCWFNNIDTKEIEKKITMAKTIAEWSTSMKNVFKELYRITIPNGYVAFEVGEVKKGKYNLDEYIVPIGEEIGFHCIGILINDQAFTKTANIWGINNNKGGTNTNRIAIFQK